MKRWLFLLVPLIALGWLVGWRMQTKKAAAVAAVQQRQARGKMAPAVSLATAQVRDVVRSFEAIGSVDAPLSVKVASEITGRIVFLQVREGDPVRRGQVLVRIDAAELRAQVAQRRATVAEAKYRLAQAAENEAPTAVSVSADIRQQEAAVASAQARATQAEQHFEAQVAAAKAAVTDVEGRLSSVAASIDNAEAAIRSAQANLDNARAAHKRVNDLYQQGYIAAQDVDNARTTVSVQEAALDAARGQLKAAAASRDSALAQKHAAEKQVEIARAKSEADVEAARAQVAQARAALEFAQANTARKPAYRQSLSALQASIDAAQASLENAQAMLARTEIASPIDGFVTARTMDPGAVATPGQAILAVQAMRQVWVTVPVPEEAHRRIRKGRTATVTLDALPGQQLSGAVTQINAAADPVSRQFSIRITLDNPGNRLKPGMFARVTMETERAANAVVVPPEAVQERKGKKVVIVVGADQVAHERPVVTGISDDKGIAIAQGVQPGERVVVMSTAPVRDGQEVRSGGGKPGGKEGGPPGAAEGRDSGGPGGEGPRDGAPGGERQGAGEARPAGPGQPAGAGGGGRRPE